MPTNESLTWWHFWNYGAIYKCPDSGTYLTYRLQRDLDCWKLLLSHLCMWLITSSSAITERPCCFLQAKCDFRRKTAVLRFWTPLGDL